MDMSQYKSLFLSEAREYLKTINQTVAALEESPEDRTAIDALFRGAHSLKGMAASMDYYDIVQIAHNMEDLMIRVREETLGFDAGVADLLLEAADLIEGLLNDVEQDLKRRRSAEDLTNRLAAFSQKPAPPIAQRTPQERQGSQEEALAESCLQTPAQAEEASPAQAASQAEEASPVQAASPEEKAARGEAPLLAPAPAAGPAPSPVQPAPAGQAERQTPREAEREREPAGEISAIRVKTEVLDHLVNLTGELITNKQRLLNIGQELGSVQLNVAISQTAKLLRALHNEVMKVRLMPFDAICDGFQRSVRSLAKKNGKELHFQLEGREIGLDRGILEQLADPLNHILRNAVGHGLESSEERIAAGKPAKGTIRLSVSQDRDRIVITVNDDGRGMEPKLMTAAAVGKGLISPEEAELLTPRQALMLACMPGFSTAKEVTDVSGRGVGMDAVSASIRKLGGSLAIESEPGQGSSFTLRLPMTIAIIHALIVQCGALKVAVPVSAVQRSVELRRAEVETLGKRRVFQLEGETVPLLSLNRILGLPLARFRDGFMSLFVTEAKGRRVGVVVDRLLGQQELFVKPLGRPLGKLPWVEGGAILSDGEIVIILNVAELV